MGFRETPRKSEYTLCYSYIHSTALQPFPQIPVEIGKDASMKDLRQILGRWMDANPDNVRYHPLAMFFGD